MSDSAAIGHRPAGSTADEPLYLVSMDRTVAIRVSAYGVVLLFVALQLSDLVAGTGPPNPWLGGVWDGVALLGIMVATVVVHELVHGAFFALFGSTRPQFGLGMAGKVLPYAYATAPGQPFNLSQFTVIGLAPFVLISTACLAVAIALPAAAPLATVAFVTNFSGACGDLWMVSQIWRFRGSEGLRLVDLRDGVAIYARGERSHALAARLTRRHRSEWTRFLTAAFLAWLVTLFAAMLIPLVLLILDVRGEFTIGPEAFPLLAISRPVDGASSATIGLLPPLVAALAFAALYTMLRRLR